jgi:sulfur-oxidizing protein SoxX
VVGTLALALLASAGDTSAQVAEYKVVGDGIPQSLTGKPGDAVRGRALLVKRGAANCLTCHSIKDKDMQPGGKRGPALDGVGAALTPAQLRLSVVDFSRVTRGAAMPSFHKSGVGKGDAPALSAEEVEDVVAYLASLKK